MAQNALNIDVWKELAISKQMLIRTATDALGLDPECSEEELKESLERGIEEIRTADQKVAAAKAEIQSTLDDLQQRLTAAEKQIKETQEASAAVEAENARLQGIIEADRKVSGDEIAKLKALVDEKTKALKSINTLLGDTPQNVAKKIKALNKKKHEDLAAKKRIEDELKNLKKERTEQNKKATAKEEQAKAITVGYRALQAYCDEQYDRLKELLDGDSENTLTAPPKLADELFADLEDSKD